MRSKSFGLLVESSRDGGFKVTRYGHRFYSRTFNTYRTAAKWLERAKEECEIDALAGCHFAPAIVRQMCLKGAAIAQPAEA